MKEYEAKLIFPRSDRAPITIEIEDEVLLKRSSTTFSVVCEIDIDTMDLGIFDSTVSGGDGHARIFWENGTLYIQDLGSKNGTYLLGMKSKIPLKGWKPKNKKETFPSEKVPLKKSRELMIGSLKFRLELKRSSVNIFEQHVHGDYLHEGASKVTIEDSVIQRSNIGSGISVNDDLDEKINWLDERNRRRAAHLSEGQEGLREGQREIGKGMTEIYAMTEDMANRMERHFSELALDLPYPSNIRKKRGTVTMEYGCPRCGKLVGKIKDRRWTKWVNFAVGAGMIGVGIAAFSAEIGGKGVKKMYNDLTGKQLDDLPKNSLFLTSEEKDKMLTLLREEGILHKMSYCPSCKRWVCIKCFDPDTLLCRECG